MSCLDLVAVILEVTLLVTSAPLTTAETHSREDEHKERKVETNPSFENLNFKIKESTDICS